MFIVNLYEGVSMMCWFYMDLSCELKYVLFFGDDIFCIEKVVESKIVYGSYGEK